MKRNKDLIIFRRVAICLSIVMMLTTLCLSEVRADSCEFDDSFVSDRPSLHCRLHLTDPLVSGLNSDEANVPAALNFQARLSQAKILLGDRTISRLEVGIYSLSDQLLCSMTKADVVVDQSVLDLSLAEVDLNGCQLAQVLANHNQLKVKVCLGNQNCLRPLKLSAVPYALKSEFTYWALRANNVESSSISNYAERMTADRDLLNSARKGLSQNRTGELIVNGLRFPESLGAGTLLWKTRSASANLYIASKDYTRDQPQSLRRLSWVSHLSLLSGGLKVLGLAAEDGRESEREGLEVADGDIRLINPLSVSESVDVLGVDLNDQYQLTYGSDLHTTSTQLLATTLARQFGLFVAQKSSDSSAPFLDPNLLLLEVKGSSVVRGFLQIGESLLGMKDLSISDNAQIFGRLNVANRTEVKRALVDQAVSFDLQATHNVLVDEQVLPSVTMGRLEVATETESFAPLRVTEGDVSVSGDAMITGRSVLRDRLSVAASGTRFTTRNLTLSLRDQNDVERDISILKSDADVLSIGEPNKKLIIHGKTRILGRVSFDGGVDTNGGCRIEIPGDQVGRPVRQVKRFSLVCGETSVILRPFRCGNGDIDPGEQCDEGDLIDGDGCSSHCLCEPENLIDGIYFEPSRDDDDDLRNELRACAGDLCGNNKLDRGEECDDGTAEKVTLESYNDLDRCEGCLNIGCGNGIRSLDEAGVPEQCDDGNIQDGDGCNRQCQIEDADGDGIADHIDNCVNDQNVNQINTDNDRLGDECDDDDDNDGLTDVQEDTNNNGVPDAGETDLRNPDTDGDSVLDGVDNCPLAANLDQEDRNGDGLGDACAAPVARADTYQFTEDQSVNADQVVSLLINDEYGNGNPTISTRANNNDEFTLANELILENKCTLRFNNDGTFKFTPAQNAEGTVTFQYMLRTGNVASQPATVSILIEPQDDPPVGVPDTYTVNEDTLLNVNGANFPKVTSNDQDPDLGDTPNTFTVTQGNTQVANGTLNLNPDGTFTYDPNDHFVGDDQFTYVVWDADGLPALNETTVTITVSSQDDAPSAQSVTYNTDEDTSITKNLLAGATDPDVGDILSAEIVSFDQNNGTLVLDETTYNFTYTPANDLFGAVTFIYRVTDDEGLSSNDATITILIRATNDEPRANPLAFTYSTNEDTTLTMTSAYGLLSNIADVDHSDEDLTITTIPAAPSGLTLAADGSFTFEPEDNSTEAFSFTYTVSDNGINGANPLASEVVTVTINILPINDAPRASPTTLTYPTVEDETLTVTSENGLLSNITDVDHNTEDLTITTNPAVIDGVTLAADGSFTFDPIDNSTTTVSFTYRVSDNGVNGANIQTSEEITVNLNITAVNDAPTGGDKTFNMTAGDTLTQDAATGLLQNVSDVESHDLRIVADDVSEVVDAGDNPQGILVVNADGSFTYTPPNDFTGSVSFTYRVRDNGAPEAVSEAITVLIQVN